MYKSFRLALLLLLNQTADAQPISRHEANSLARIVNGHKRDFHTLYALLKIAEFHIMKSGELTADPDSGSSYTEKARALNDTLHSTEAKGYICLVESYLLREKPGGKVLL